MRYPRFDFKDYPANEQERDVQKAMRKGVKDVYILKVNGIWQAYMPRKVCPISVSANKNDSLNTFYESLKKTFEKEFKIKIRFRNIRNQGIEDYLKQQLIIHKLLNQNY